MTAVRRLALRREPLAELTGAELSLAVAGSAACPTHVCVPATLLDCEGRFTWICTSTPC